MNNNLEKEFIFDKEIEDHIETTKHLINIKNKIFELDERITKAFSSKNKILICGNGGSAADAQHLSSELLGRYEKERKGYPAISLSSDVSAMTAIGNDYGFENIFSKQISAIGVKDDILICISTSGNSKNIIKAVETSNKMNIYTFGLLGKDGGKLKNIVNDSIIVKNSRTCRIQEMHGLLIHILCELIDRKI